MNPITMTSIPDHMWVRLDRLKMRLVQEQAHLGDIDDDIDGDDRLDSIVPGGAYQKIQQAIDLINEVLEE